MALTFTESTLSLLAEEKDGLVASLREQLVSEKAASGLLRAECEAERRKCAVYRDLARSLMEGTAGDTEADAILEGVASAAESGLEASRRLSEAEAAMSGLEAEIASLRAKVGALEKENASLRAKLEEADSSRPTCADAVTALLGGKLVGRCSSDEVDPKTQKEMTEYVEKAGKNKVKEKKSTKKTAQKSSKDKSKKKESTSKSKTKSGTKKAGAKDKKTTKKQDKSKSKTQQSKGKSKKNSSPQRMLDPVPQF